MFDHQLSEIVFGPGIDKIQQVHDHLCFVHHLQSVNLLYLVYTACYRFTFILDFFFYL